MITDYGFDESLTNFEGLGPKLLPLTKKPGQKNFKKIWAGSEKLKGETIWMDRSKITSGFCDAAIKFMKKAEADKKPFYVNLWPDDVHSPFFPPLDKWGNKSKRDIYLGVLKAMDDQFARLFDYVKKSETLKNNTLILICSDNGFEPGAGQAGPLKGCKTNLYEGGIRSSLVVWGLGLISKEKMGSRNKTSLFSAIDILPSLLTIAGAKGEANTQYDGEDLSAVILGRSDDSRKQPIFYRRPPDRKNFYGYKDLPDLAIRKGNFKLLCDFDGGRPLLYDITRDEGETKNLASQYPEKVKELAKLAMDWNKTMPTDAGNQTQK
jgi:arylsulfatase A-like enzyme